MPLYEYECAACGRRFERIQKFSDPPVTTCPECGGGVRRLVSSPAIQFKGSGWYITDYARKGGDKPARDKDDKAAKSPESTAEAKPADAKTPAASDSSKPAAPTTGGGDKK